MSGRGGIRLRCDYRGHEYLISQVDQDRYQVEYIHTYLNRPNVVLGTATELSEATQMAQFAINRLVDYPADHRR